MILRLERDGQRSDATATVYRVALTSSIYIDAPVTGTPIPYRLDTITKGAGADFDVRLIRQRLSDGRDYEHGGVRTLTGEELRKLRPSQWQEIADALVRVDLDEQRKAAERGVTVERQTETPRAEVDYAAGDRTLFPADPSTEYMLPELADDEDFHVVARVGDIEMREEWRAGEWLRVRDERSGLWVEARRAADCGAECECGGEVRLVEQPGEEREALDDDAPEGTPTHWQPCANGDGRRTMHASGLCSACRQQLDATMRDQMAQWPDDTLALLTVGELRGVLRRAVEAGATVADDDSIIVEQLVRDLPISDEERAAHGLLSPVDVRDVSALKAFERPGSAYEGVYGYDPHTHEAITDLRIVAIIEQLRYAVVNGVGVSLDAEHAAVLGQYLGWTR